MTREDKLLPANRDAERFVLGSVLMDGRKFEMASTLEPEDFSVESDRRIFRSMKDLHDRGESIDIVTVANALGFKNELESVGGLSYLVSLDDGMPQLVNLDSYVRIIKRDSLRRKCIYLGKVVMETAWSAEDPQVILTAADGYIQRLWAESEQTRSRAQSGSDLLSDVLNMASERERRYKDTGKPAMGIETGIAKLDELLNGLNAGLHLLGGGPGVGKTSFSLQLSLEACRQGFLAFYVTYENSPSSLILKAVCARAGVTPRDIERGMAHADQLSRFRAAASELKEALARLVIIEGSTSLQIGEVRAKILKVLRRSDTGACLVVFDYLQRAAMAQGYSEIRRNVSSLAGQLRDLANHLQSPILALSSQNRARGYASRDNDSLKESGDLEYTGDMVMFLNKSDRGATPPAVAVEVTVSKQRFGPVDASVPLIFRPDIGVFREEETQRKCSTAASQK
jgi:replicative DNA helicase